MKKVAAYVRVSTSKADQIHSYEFQYEYWYNTLSKNPEYDYAGIYADKGISGKYAAKRPQLMALINDCDQGKIDMIFTKSVSRFARNLEETLSIVHHLRDIGIGIYFERENINTLNPSSDLYLSVAATLAENDLKESSRRIRAGIDMRTELGIISIGNGMFGYKLKDNELETVEKEARIVRKIFKWYLEGGTLAEICENLNTEGIKSRRGGLWCGSTIRKMLSNEKYCGDVIIHKYVSEDGSKKINDGDAVSKKIENNHQPIVSREIFDQVQEELKKRAKEKLVGQPNKEYPFTGKVICGLCGKKYTHKFNNANTPYRSEIWSCSTYLKNGKAFCDSHSIKDKVLKDKFVEAFNQLVESNYESEDVAPLREEHKRLLSLERNMITLKTRGMLSIDGFQSQMQDIIVKTKNLKHKIGVLTESRITKKDLVKITSFDEEKAQRLVEKVIVQNWTVTFHFVNGAVIVKDYENGTHGNIRDWVIKNRRK